MGTGKREVGLIVTKHSLGASCGVTSEAQCTVVCIPVYAIVLFVGLRIRVTGDTGLEWAVDQR